MSHSTSAPRIVRLRHAASLLVACLVIAALSAMTAWAKLETWRQEGPTAFAKAHREGVVISDTGRVRLGHAVSPLGSLKVDRVWDLARTSGGALFAATGDAGK